MAHIKTYARLKPPKKPNDNFSVNNNVLTIQVPDGKDGLQMGGLWNRSATTYDVTFDGVFSPETTQQEVFDNVAKNIIESFLTGFNGTIFAYGQTGTGKTYTVEGNSCRYQSRGLATRALSAIYEELEKRKDEHISVYLSYLEIYQEVAYDLLNPASRTMLPVLPFSKVTVVEGPNGSCILRGLSVHLAANEDVAQMLLLQGQANRHVAETTVNQRSSRSHAVFTVYLQSRKKDSQIILNSKLHLVDLAGSERVSKTGVDGQQLTEAKSINLSLHHLETVIIFLQAAGNEEQQQPQQQQQHQQQQQQQQQTSSNHKSPSVTNSRSSNSMMSHPSSDFFPLKRSRKHIPYRNSLLTMILKDSLGGNCLTAMIATLSLEPENICESLSTCRFAQRVARVANFAKRNEEIDDKMLIKKLKIKVAQLETKLALILSETGENPDSLRDGSISPQNEVDCQRVIEEFLQGIIDDPVSAGITTHIRFRECLHLMKCRMLQTSPTTNPNSALNPSSPPRASKSPMKLTTHSSHPYSDSDSCSSPTATKRGAETAGAKRQESVHVTWAKDYHHSSSVESKGITDSPLIASPKFYPPLESLLAHGDGSSQEEQQQHQQPQLQPPPRPSLSPPKSAPLIPQPEVRNNSNKHIKKNASEMDKLEICDEMDDIDRLLMEATSTSTSGSNGYKTPFERKREQKIKKLGKALSNIEDEKVAQEQELEFMKQDTVLDSLRMEEDGLRLKLQVADEQVADQHAYILHLKHIESDPEMLAQEALVEKQLQKRQAKFQAKLKDVRERRIGVEKELAEMAGERGKSPSDKKSSRTFEERYGQYRQNKGSLNTRQVFEMLKNEEKKQKKEISLVEREKTVVKTRQLELKEMATWEKLRELKQMLKMSQQEGRHLSSSQQQRLEEYSEGEQFLSSNGNNKGDTSNQVFSTVPLSSTDVAGIRSPNDLQQQQETQPPFLQSQEKSHSVFISEYIQSVQEKINHECQVPATNHEKGQANGNDGKTKNTWLTPVTASPTNPSTDPNYDITPHPSEKFAVGDSGGLEPLMLNTNNSNKNNNNSNGYDDNGNDDNNNSSYDFNHVKQLLSPTRRNKSGTDLFPTWSAHKMPLNTDPNQDQSNSDNGAAFQNPPPTSSSTFCNSLTAQQDHKETTKTSVTLDPSPSMEDIMAMLTPSTVQVQSSSDTPKSSSPTMNHKLLPPSEYINTMTEQERFDARKMGLSSRTFESALSHMLDADQMGSNAETQNVPDLPYSVDVYESYTRKTSKNSRPYHSQSHTHTSSHYNRNKLRSTYSSHHNHQHQSYHHHKRESNSSQRNAYSSKDFNQEGLRRNRKQEKEKEAKFSATDRLDKVLEEQTGSTWGPNVKNISIADRLSGLFDDTPVDMLPSKNTATHQNNKYKDLNGVNNLVVDLENTKDNDEEEDDLGGVIVDRSCSEDDLFFGQHTPRTAITAVKKEEGEKTFMSRVASERERIAKIRKARHAAEVIQKYWRQFKTQ